MASPRVKNNWAEAEVGHSWAWLKTKGILVSRKHFKKTQTIIGNIYKRRRTKKYTVLTKKKNSNSPSKKKRQTRTSSRNARYSSNLDSIRANICLEKKRATRCRHRCLRFGANRKPSPKNELEIPSKTLKRVLFGAFRYLKPTKRASF